MIPNSKEIRFEVSTHCNYHCLMCARDSFTRKKENMSFSLFKELLDKILSETDQYTSCTLSGFGEPLLNTELPEMFAYARKRNLHTLLLTNGSLLTGEIYDKISDTVDSIRISIYGNSPEIYAKVHGCNPDQFSTTYQNLHHLIRNRKCEVILNYIVLDGVNESETEAWIQTWNDKADLIEVWKPHNWAVGKHYRKTDGEKVLTCGRPFHGPLQIQVDGTVNVCCFDYNGETVIGNLKTQSLEKIFCSEAFQKIITAHTTGDYDNLICKNCDQRNKNKNGIMLYNSKYDIKQRINQTSTSYENLSL